MRRFFLLILLFWMVTAVYAQGEPTEIGPIRLQLPDAVQTQPDEFGVFFASDSDTLAFFQSMVASAYETMTGGSLDSSSSPDAPSGTYVAGVILVLDAATARTNPMISDALASSQRSGTMPALIDGRRAVYNISENNRDSVVQFGAVIDDPVYTIVILALASSDSFDSQVFLTTFNSIEFVNDAPDPTPISAQSSLSVFGFNTQPTVPAFNGLAITDAVSVLDIVGPIGAVLSPDGTRIAGATRDGLCIVATADLPNPPTPQCFPVRNILSRSQMSWSPDGRYLAFHEDAIQRLNDSDLWVIDTQTNRMLNYTDDGFEGGYFSTSRLESQGVTSVNLDMTPAWNGSTVYFFRTIYSGGDSTPTGLYRLTLDGNITPEMVTAFSTRPRDFASISNNDAVMDLSGSAVVSPSGRWLAAVYRPFERENAAILRFDLGTGAVETLAAASQFQGGLPAYFTEPMLLSGVAWLPDESGLIVSTAANPSGPTTAMGNAYQLDFASGDVTPLLDFSGVADETGMPAQLIPYDIQVLPDGSALVWAGRIEGSGSLWSAPLPLSDTPYTPDSLPAAVGTFEGLPLRYATSIGQQDETVTLLVGGQFITLRRE